MHDAIVVGPGGVVWIALSGLPEHRTRQQADGQVQLSAERYAALPRISRPCQVDQHDRPQGRVPQHTVRARVVLRLDIRDAPREVPLAADANGPNVGTHTLLVRGGIHPQGRAGRPQHAGSGIT